MTKHARKNSLEIKRIWTLGQALGYGSIDDFGLYSTHMDTFLDVHVASAPILAPLEGDTITIYMHPI